MLPGYPAGVAATSPPYPTRKLSRKVRETRSSSLCSAHLARITRCKFLQPLRYLCQFMYLTIVKRVLRNSFDLNYLRKMCGTWVQAAKNGPSPPLCVAKAENQELAASLLPATSLFPANWLHDFTRKKTYGF